MKIWVKIFAFVFITTILSVQIVLSIATGKLKEQVIELNGEKLKAIAVSAAAIIDANMYSMVDFVNNKEYAEDEYFNQIRNHLRKTKKNLGLKEEIYTLNKVDNNSAVFGIMTNNNSFVGDTLHLISPTAKQAVKNVYENKQSQYTQIYTDQYGTWLSGLAPILLNDKVIGIVQVDHESSHIYAEFEEIENYINYFRLGSLPILLLLSVLISRIISKPLIKVTAMINEIAKGNYSEHKKIKAYGEIKELVESTNLMRKTILEQQSKIFASMNDLQKAYENLEKAKEKVDASDKLKSEFLILISHEIRTPLNVMIGNLDFLRTEYDSISEEDRAEIFDSVKTGSDRLMRTIDLIVTLAEIQSGSYEANFEEINLNALVSEVIESYKERADVKGIELNLINNFDSVKLTADQYSLRQIISNLIDNAIKFTHIGKVDVVLKEDNNELNLEVRDTGIGISDEFLPQIFDAFKQEEAGYSRKYDGNGLGLTLIQKCSEINKCKIEVESEKGKGTSFKILFSEVKMKQKLKERDRVI